MGGSFLVIQPELCVLSDPAKFLTGPETGAYQTSDYKCGDENAYEDTYEIS